MPGRGDQADSDDGVEQWVEINRKYAELWPNITQTIDAPADADEMNGVAGKFEKYFSEKPGEGS